MMYRIDVMNPDRIDPGLRQAWIELARDCGLTTPLLHPDFTLLMGRVRKDVPGTFRDSSGRGSVDRSVTGLDVID